MRLTDILHPRGRIGALAGALAIAAMFAGPAQAQLATATLEGHVTAGPAATAGATVTATNVDTGRSAETKTDASGAYTLVGLPPGNYRIDVATPEGRRGSENIAIRVGQTLQFDMDLQARAAAAGQPEEVVVVGTHIAERKTSEVAVNVSPVLMQNLPQITRNLLSFADLAPGVRFTQDQNTGNVRLQSGAQNQDNVNLFIDGVSQKNYVLRGGIAGMDSTRGNPFPQSAIAEYKVITQNYKAEYDQVSSVAISAVTKSGTNELHGDAFVDRTGTNWTAYDPFQQQNEAAGVPRPSAHQEQFGLSVGGPIIQNRAHFFLAYEGKDITQPRQVVLQNANLLPNAGLVPGLAALQGGNDAKFKEHLFLAKIDAQLTDSQDIELTGRIRREDDYVPENTLLSVVENSKDRSNDETRFDLKHSWTHGDWLNEARIGYQDTVWNPHSKASTAQLKYYVSPSNSTNNVSDVLWAGGSPDAQNRGQKGTLLQDDLTFTGLAGHTFKAGAKVNFARFNLSGTAFGVPVCRILLDNTTGLDSATLNPLSCPGTTLNAFQVDPALAAATADFSDTQIGIYFQDDWKATDKLTLNLGIRWDYETNMLNDDYVTPADRVTALYALDGPRWGITPPPGQTYAQSLAKGGINIADYIADGHSRKAYTGAFAPRVGFAYDVFDDLRTVVFGGFGRAYDRTMANHALDELQKNKQPNGEIWLIKNDHKMAYTDQISIGLRQALGAVWRTEIGYTNSYSHNQFNWFGGNRDANGGWATQSPIDPLWGGPIGYGTLILGDFITQAKTQTAYVTATKEFNEESGWGLTATYTYSDGKTTNRQWTNDIFNWTYGKPGADGWNPSVDVEKHRLIVTGLTNKLIPWGVMLSGKVTLGSGLPFQITSCAAGWSACVFQEGKGDNYRQVDLALSKDFDVWRSKLGLRIDVLNLFNTVNYGGYDGWGGGPGNPQNQWGGDNPNTGKPNSMGGPMRTFRLVLNAHL